MGMWDKYTYCLMIDFCDAKGKRKSCYVTKVDKETKEFRWATTKDIQSGKAKVMTFREKSGLDLMNRIFLNGYDVSLKPYFDNSGEA